MDPGHRAAYLSKQKEFDSVVKTAKSIGFKINSMRSLHTPSGKTPNNSGE